MPDQLTVGVVCTRGIGPARGGRERNEDNYVVCRGREARFRDGDRERVSPVQAHGILIAVADGMGGHEHGDLASSAAVQAMTRLFRRGYPADPQRVLYDFVIDAHHRLRHKASELGPVRMGTTLTAAWVVEGQLHWCQVGDSRLYHWRRGALQQLTRDQTWKEFSERDGFALRGNEGQHLAQNFVFGSRGFGDDTSIRLDYGVDTGTIALQDGDRLVLCSDGLCAFVNNPRISDVLGETPDPQSAATTLVERAMAAGSDDNVTAMVVRIDEVDAPHFDAMETEDSGDESTLVPLD